VLDRLTKLSITFNDLEEFVKLMQDFGANEIQKWYKVLDKLSDVKIRGFDNVKTFILLITGFGVRYEPTFIPFMEIIMQFGADFSTSLDTIIDFVGDMKYVGYMYDRNQMEVDGLINYFIRCRYTLDTYRGGSSTNSSGMYSSVACAKDPKIMPPTGLPQLLVRTFYEYKSPNYSNRLYDIRTISLLDNLPFCDVIDSMHQAYMLANNDDNITSYNGVTQNFIPNATLVTAFFYKEEFFQILNKPSAYTDEKVVLIMRDIANGMDRYAITIKDKPEYFDSYVIYISLAKTTRSFPAVTFQYMSNLIATTCKDGCLDLKQSYSKYIDAGSSYSKADTSDPNGSYRPSKPIL